MIVRMFKASWTASLPTSPLDPSVPLIGKAAVASRYALPLARQAGLSDVVF